MPRRPHVAEPLLIEDQADLDAFCARIREAGRFAFDTEFVMEDRYRPELCVLQAATPDAVAVIDALADLNLDPVWALVQDPDVQTIVHAGQEDLAICAEKTGIGPQRVFDAQIAAGLVSVDYPLSLQRLVQWLLHVRLHKSKTLTDWRRRPLTAEQVHYAAEDVAFLPQAHARLVEELTKKGRIEWADEEFERLCALRRTVRLEPERGRNVKGAGSLRGQQAVVLQAVMHWREQLARRINRPPRVLLKDHLIVEIARHSLSTAEEIRHLRGVNLGRRELGALVEVVQAALRQPVADDQQGGQHEPELHGQAALTALVTAVIRSLCEQCELAYSLAATKRSIEELVRHALLGEPAEPQEVELLRGWRREFVGSRVLDVVTGKRRVRVEAGPSTAELHLDPAEHGAEDEPPARRGRRQSTR